MKKLLITILPFGFIYFYYKQGNTGYFATSLFLTIVYAFLIGLFNK